MDEPIGVSIFQKGHGCIWKLDGCIRTLDGCIRKLERLYSETGIRKLRGRIRKLVFANYATIHISLMPLPHPPTSPKIVSEYDEIVSGYKSF